MSVKSCLLLNYIEYLTMFSRIWICNGRLIFFFNKVFVLGQYYANEVKKRQQVT